MKDFEDSKQNIVTFFLNYKLQLQIFRFCLLYEDTPYSLKYSSVRKYKTKQF